VKFVRAFADDGEETELGAEPHGGENRGQGMGW
jgi:hypothetical protein